MRVLIGGGSGFVGRYLTKLLQEKGHDVIHVSRTVGPNRITWVDLQKRGLPKKVTAVVSMAGETLLNPFCRWNSDLQERLRSSRVDTTRSLVQAMQQAEDPPSVFVSTSGVGYYEPSETAEYTEDSSGGDFDFVSRLGTEWEAAAKIPSGLNCRQAIIRLGVVLGRDGGAIQQMFPPFYLGVGGRIASGKQWFPWIHVEDAAAIYCHAIENESVEGILNGVAPQPATNAQFTQTFAQALWRPAIFPVPAFVMNTVFGPERGKVLTEGQKVIPKRTLESGYQYLYPDLASACKEFSVLIHGKTFGKKKENQ